MTKRKRRLWTNCRASDNFFLEEDLTPEYGYFKDTLKEVLPQLEDYECLLEQKIQCLIQEQNHVQCQISGIKKILGEFDDL